ncbi:hypothetical protein MHU86_12389 [Fragilaria crotonensis]|nr:hypothetical protein MHU86_12389 [Fragilaria crotonensis]
MDANMMLLLFLVIVLSLVDLCQGEIESNDPTIEGGNLRYFFDKASGDIACQNVVLLGVGTGMSVQDYDLVSTEIVSGHNILTVVFDFAPGYPLKNSEEDYIKLINAVVANLSTLVPICNATAGTKRTIVVGGHSASGAVAWKCLKRLNFQPDGFIGLDPFVVHRNGAKQIEIPSLSFGFTKSTCLALVYWAAKALYTVSGKDRRVLYLIDNNKKQGSKDIAVHCSFSDKGCFGLICPEEEGDPWVRELVGFSIQTFFRSLSKKAIIKKDYEHPKFTTCPASTPITYHLYVNEDEV